MIITNLSIDAASKKNKEHIQFARDIEMGLSVSPKKLPSKYFYDDNGSQIFQLITKLDEYYPTRTEIEILNTLKNQLPDLINENEIDIVELGVGDGHKTKILIESFLNKNVKVNFYPIDISHEAMILLEQNIAYPNMNTHGIVAEYLEGLKFARSHSLNRQIVLFLGSNLGNFSREESEDMLKSIHHIMYEKDFLLIGFDLKKDINLMNRAYSDSEGVTAKFNLNLLARINSELGGNFNLEQFSHEAHYNPAIGAMESYLISLCEQDVYIAALNKTFHFDEFEGMHLEYSFKYSEKEIEHLSELSGFHQLKNFSDPNHYFVDSLWQV
jgi:dimethylhistidine N-methyltransferase